MFSTERFAISRAKKRKRKIRTNVGVQQKTLHILKWGMENEEYKTVNKTQVFLSRASGKSSVEAKHMFGKEEVK